MAVNPKERKALEKMWDDAKPTGGADIPDGDYTFVIVKAKPNMSDKGRPSMQQMLKISEGPEAFVGQEIPVRDNLESADNMGWFKKKLGRLGVEIPNKEDFIEQLLNGETGEGSLAAAMVGKKFVGTVKTKNDFLNVYVNKLVGEESVSDSSSEDESTEADSGEEAVEVGDVVSFTSKNDGAQQGEVLEIIGDAARVKTTTGEKKTYKLPIDKLTIVYEEESEEEVEEEEEAPKGKAKKADADEESEEEEEEAPKAKGKPKKPAAFPSRSEIEEMRLPEIKEALAEHGFDADDVKSPRSFAAGVAGFVEDGKDYMPEITELAPLCAALGVKYKKGDAPKAAVKALLAAVEERFS